MGQLWGTCVSHHPFYTCKIMRLLPARGFQIFPEKRDFFLDVAELNCKANFGSGGEGAGL